MMQTQPLLKPPLSYYGGKQNMVRDLLAMMPPHRVYIEPFFGGGTLFFAKRPAEVEVINDRNDDIVNFYRVLKTDFEALVEMVDCTLHSRSHYRQAAEILKGGKGTAVERAWAAWVQCNMSFGNKMFGGWAFCGDTRQIRATVTAKAKLKKVRDRLEMTYIDCDDALSCIQNFDKADAFIYVDPPYVSSDQGHYEGYLREDMQRLLECLAQVKGKFLLSSYPEQDVLDAVERYGWNISKNQKTVSVNGKRNGQKMKIECLTWNYKVTGANYDLF